MVSMNYGIIIQHRFDSVKSIIGIAYLEAITVGYRRQLAVVRIVGIGSELVVARFYLGVVSEDIVAEDIVGGLGAYRAEKSARIGVFHRFGIDLCRGAAARIGRGADCVESAEAIVFVSRSRAFVRVYDRGESAAVLVIEIMRGPAERVGLGRHRAEVLRRAEIIGGRACQYLVGIKIFFRVEAERVVRIALEDAIGRQSVVIVSIFVDIFQCEITKVCFERGPCCVQ